MPTTRSQTSRKNREQSSRNKDTKLEKSETGGIKRLAEEVTEVKEEDGEPATKKVRFDEKGQLNTHQTGTIERGHIYFFYRPKVQLEEVHSIQDVKNFHMLLVPRPPEFSIYAKPGTPDNEDEKADPTVLLEAGADAVPMQETLDEPYKHFRLITIGKKQLPNPESGGVGKGRKQTFWATVTSVGDDLHGLEQGLGEKTYETKTRGTRHDFPARLAARGAYAIVNNDPEIPSKRTTHFGYHISHPADPGDVQESLGIGKAASFVLQVKNPLAPATSPLQVRSKGAEYPDEIMFGVFGKGGGKGRKSYGLRFSTCETSELLDYKGAELLLIAARGGEEGLEASLGGGRGQALEHLGEKESRETIETLFRELDVDSSTFPAAPLQGNWI